MGGWKRWGFNPGDYCITNQQHVFLSISSYVIASTGHAKLWHNIKNILVFLYIFIFAQLCNFPVFRKTDRSWTMAAEQSR